MSFKEQLETDLKNSLKSGDQFKVGVLRLLAAAMHNKEIENRSKTGTADLSAEQIIQLLSTEAKKRHEAMEIFGTGKRQDLQDKERRELEIIQGYLPKQLSREETEKLVHEIVKRAGAQEFGQTMKMVMKELRGKVDAKFVGAVVKKLLSQ